jgi:Terpene cyclase DEP1
MLKLVVGLVLIPFTALSIAALWHVGYLGLFTQQFANFGTQQVLADLLIAVSICMYWMWHDAQKTGRNPWPWIALSLVSGSFGPLLYLITSKKKA